MARKKQTETPLQLLGKIANTLESDDFLDNVTRAQKKGLRDAADALKSSLEETLPELTADNLVAFFTGMAAQAAMKPTDPLSALVQAMTGERPEKGKQPNGMLMIIVAYLARDILAGERVE